MKVFQIPPGPALRTLCCLVAATAFHSHRPRHRTERRAPWQSQKDPTPGAAGTECRGTVRCGEQGGQQGKGPKQTPGTGFHVPSAATHSLQAAETPRRWWDEGPHPWNQVQPCPAGAGLQVLVPGSTSGSAEHWRSGMGVAGAPAPARLLCRPPYSVWPARKSRESQLHWHAWCGLLSPVLKGSAIPTAHGGHGATSLRDANKTGSLFLTLAPPRSSLRGCQGDGASFPHQAP